MASAAVFGVRDGGGVHRRLGRYYKVGMVSPLARRDRWHFESDTTDEK